MVAHLDFESRSRLNLNDCGSWRYFEHDSTRLLCLAYCLDETEEVRLWHPDFPLVPEELRDPWDSLLPGTPPPRDLFDYIASGGELWAHNATFERVAFELFCGPRLGWPVPHPEQWRCTMALCAAGALPLSLDRAASFLGVDQRKDLEGKKVMMRLTRPRAPSEHDSSRWREAVEDLLKCFEYCRQDVRVEMALHKRLRGLRPQEQKLFFVDQRINFRGVAVDQQFCERARVAGKERAKKLVRESKALTGGISFTRVKAGREWLASRGLRTFDLRADTVRDLLLADDRLLTDGAGRNLPPDVRRFLELRAAGSKISTAKFARILEMVGEDGRLRLNYQYHGATTGRWAGRGVQLQNLPKGVTEREQALVIGALSAGDLWLLELLFDDPIAQLSNVIRGAFIAPGGMKLVVADFSAIEARGVYWLAGQEDLLEMYRRGKCLYCWMANQVFGVDAEEIQGGYKLDKRLGFYRFVGKQLVLGCGYNMGPTKFVSYCAKMGVPVSEELAEQAVGVYRENTPEVRKLWFHTQANAIEATENPGTERQYRNLRWARFKDTLYCKLPSGRVLSYPQPKIQKVRVELPEKVLADGTVKPARTFEAKKLHYFARWGREGTFGGKLVENCCQAMTRDLLAEAMIRCEDSGQWPVVMHSHDEVICEVPEGTPDAPRRLEEVLEVMPEWAEGMPIKAEAWEGKRYRK